MDNANTVNDVVTDSISQNNTLLLGTATPNSLGMLDIASAETFGMFMYNAVSTQQNAQISSSAATTATCARIIQSQSQPPAAPPSTETKKTPPPFMSLDGSEEISKSIAAAISKALKSGDAESLQNIQKVISGLKALNPEKPGSGSSPDSSSATSSSSTPSTSSAPSSSSASSSSSTSIDTTSNNTPRP